MSLLEAVKQVQDAAARELNGDPTAHAELLESIHKLQVVATTPAEKEQWIRFQIYQNASLRMALEYGILQALAGELGKAMSAAELSQVTKADELLIGKVAASNQNASHLAAITLCIDCSLKSDLCG